MHLQFNAAVVKRILHTGTLKLPLKCPRADFVG